MTLSAAMTVAASAPSACRAKIAPKPGTSARQQLHGAAQSRRRTAPVVRAAAETEVERPASSSSSSEPAAAAAAADPPAVQLSGRVAVLQASKQAVLDVEEAGRPLAEYMVLPASQYSVLDAQRIERLDEDTFRCYVGGLRFLGLEVEPVITVSVTVQERGPTVRLLNTKLRGSKAVEAANKRFDATMTNVVRWQEAPNGGSGKQLVSDTLIRVQLQVPGWFLLPTAAIERTGSAVMAKVLDTAVPRFLQQLAVDYAAWAAGDETRQPVANGSILDDMYEASPDLGESEQGWD